MGLSTMQTFFFFFLSFFMFVLLSFAYLYEIKTFIHSFILSGPPQKLADSDSPHSDKQSVKLK